MKYLQSYIDYILSYDLSKVESRYERSSLRLGTMFLDRVRIGYESNLVYNGRSLVELVDRVDVKDLTEVEEPITYLYKFIKMITDKDHPVCILMFFGGSNIDSKIFSKFTNFD